MGGIPCRSGRDSIEQKDGSPSQCVVENGSRNWELTQKISMDPDFFAVLHWHHLQLSNCWVTLLSLEPYPWFAVHSYNFSWSRDHFVGMFSADGSSRLRWVSICRPKLMASTNRCFQELWTEIFFQTINKFAAHLGEVLVQFLARMATRVTWTIHSCSICYIWRVSLRFREAYFSNIGLKDTSRYDSQDILYHYISFNKYSRYPRNGTLNIKIHPEINRCPPLRLAMRCKPHRDSWRANNSNSLTPYVLCFLFVCGFTMVLSWCYYGFMVGLWLLFDGLWWF